MNTGIGRNNRMKLLKNPYACVVCQKSFSITAALLKHVQTQHTGGKPSSYSKNSKIQEINKTIKDSVKDANYRTRFECKYCRKRFRKDALPIHQRIHTGKKPYSCIYCNKNFCRKDNLMIHERVHTGEKPNICKFCQKDFRIKIRLLIHERIHTGEKPYSCKYCEKKFRGNDMMKRHERIHTGETPYICDYCTKSFSSNRRLRGHQSKQKVCTNNVKRESEIIEPYENKEKKEIVAQSNKNAENQSKHKIKNLCNNELQDHSENVAGNDSKNQLKQGISQLPKSGGGGKKYK